MVMMNTVMMIMVIVIMVMIKMMMRHSHHCGILSELDTVQWTAMTHKEVLTPGHSKLARF